MNVFFDLDGVILDSEKTIIRSYELAGVQAPPNILACEGVPWLKTGNIEHIKRLKDRFYVASIRQRRVPFLSGLEVAQYLAKYTPHRVHLLTGAPCAAIDALREQVVPWPFVLAAGKLTQLEKLQAIMCFEGSCVYIDDQPVKTKHLLGRHDKIRIIRYQGQSALREEICSYA